MQDSIVETVKQINVARRSSLGDEVVGLNNIGAGVVDAMPRAGSHNNLGYLAGRTTSGRGPDPARGPCLARG